MSAISWSESCSGFLCLSSPLTMRRSVAAKACGFSFSKSAESWHWPQTALNRALPAATSARADPRDTTAPMASATEAVVKTLILKTFPPPVPGCPAQPRADHTRLAGDRTRTGSQPRSRPGLCQTGEPLKDKIWNKFRWLCKPWSQHLSAAASEDQPRRPARPGFQPALGAGDEAGKRDQAPLLDRVTGIRWKPGRIRRAPPGPAIGQVAGTRKERFHHQARPGDDETAEVLAGGIDAVDRERCSRVDDAAGVPMPVVGANDGQPAIDAQLRRVRVAIAHTRRRICRACKLGRSTDRLPAGSHQQLVPGRVRDAGHEHSGCPALLDFAPPVGLIPGPMGCRPLGPWFSFPERCPLHPAVADVD